MQDKIFKSLSKADDFVPATESSLAWVYEGATPAMTPGEAATAIQAATLGWTQDDHLQMGALQHHLAVGLGDDPERQAVCSAAAYMHVAAAGLDPGSLLNKALDPKVLRPKLGAKPEQIGKTRSGKPIYNMFTHPAHASFSTADHVDHIDAMAAHSKAKKMNKAGTPPKLSVVQHAGPKTPGGHPILHSEHPSYAHPIYNHRAKAGTNWGDEEKVKHQTLKDFSHYSAADHDAAGAHHHALGMKQKAAGGEHFQAGLRSSGISAGHQLAASHLRGLQKIKEHPGKSSEWHAGQMGGLRGGNQEHFESHRAASIHLRNMGKSMSEMYKSEAVSILEDFLSKAYGTSGPLKNFRGDKPTTGSGKVIPLTGSPQYKKVSSAAHNKRAGRA
ncbi:MAG: hypothetical protein EOO40_08885 [Deltaproteobacteria bacterium]|nr:MAG: hypothetical protein EOO40_08885 [Deltaproteobacteria bacterium]